MELQRGHHARDQSNCIAVTAVGWLPKVYFQRELQPGLAMRARAQVRVMSSVGTTGP